jgi:microcin C transport system permease protein
VRVEFLKLRKLEFVEAARAVGVSRFRLLTRHILPNAMTPILTFSPFALTAGITGLAGLDYLGFGLAPPAASWGELLNQAQKHFEHAWWLAVYPAGALMCTLLILNFIGEGLRQALDPRNGA